MYITFALLLFTLIFGGLFLYLKTKQPATIWLGLSFIHFVLGLSFLILSIFIENDDEVVFRSSLSLFTLLLFTLVLFSIALFIFNGIKIIRLEGFEFRNTLSLLMGMGSLLYLVLWPILFDLTTSGWMNTIYQFISTIVIYLGFILFLYALSNFLNLIHFKQKSIDYFIVLGAALDGLEVTPIVAGRIDKAIERQKAQHSGKLLFTGGQGPDELIPEGKAMARYAYDQGVSADRILKETESTSTEENIQFAKVIIDEDWKEKRPPVLAVVTNNYHVLRALMTAKEQGLKAVGYGSSSKFYYSLNAFLREYVAYLTMTYKAHVLVFVLIGSFSLFL